MGFSAGRTTVTTSVTMSATIPAPGNAPAKQLSGPTAKAVLGTTQELAYGTAAGEADVFCDGEFALEAGASITLNLYDGGTTATDLTTVFGAAAALRRVKSVTVAVVDGGDTTGVTIGGAASNAWAGFWSGTFDVFPGGPAVPFGSPAGAAVTATAKNLKLTNNGAAAVVVQVFVTGTSVTPGNWTGFFGLITY